MNDQHWMQLAIEQSHLARYNSKPNPNVGCVIVKNQQLIASGFTQPPGQAHAEIHALQQVDFQAADCDVYVTLEPCVHTGRTGPCTDALIKAGVKRVVIACIDPNPLVAGKGIKRLQQAGVSVDLGVLAEQASQSMCGFLTRMLKQRPYVRLKMACSLDGNIALNNGESKWITGPAARADVQLGRAESCAILTSNATVIADNPKLNLRIEDWPSPQALPTKMPKKIVLDRQLTCPLTAQIFDSHTLVFYDAALEGSIQLQLTAFKAKGVICLPATCHSQGFDLSALLIQLAKLEINNLWIECGAQLASNFLTEQLVDELIVYQAPKLLGAASQNLVTCCFQSMSEVLSLKRQDIQLIAEDIKMTFRQDK